MTNDKRQTTKSALRFVLCPLSFVLCFLGCPQKEAKKAALEPPPNQIIEDFRLQETVDGRMFYDLTAEKAYVFEDANRIDVTQPRVRFYDDECQMTSTLTAESGSVNSKTSDLVAHTNVLVKTRDSTTLETDSLVWRNKERLITTDAPVNMRSPSGNVSGVGLTSDADLRRIEIRNTVQATTTIEFQRKDTATIRTDSAAADTNPKSP